jgi:hypothetical protein
MKHFGLNIGFPLFEWLNLYSEKSDKFQFKNKLLNVKFCGYFPLTVPTIRTVATRPDHPPGYIFHIQFFSRSSSVKKLAWKCLEKVSLSGREGPTTTEQLLPLKLDI